jgi:hypothetical protein
MGRIWVEKKKKLIMLLYGREVNRDPILQSFAGGKTKRPGNSCL